MSTTFSDECTHSFSHVWCNLVEFLCQRSVLSDKMSICLAQENQEMYPWTYSGKLNKNEMPNNGRQQTLIALVKKTSLHLDYWKATGRLEPAGYNMIWPAWATVQSKLYCVFITLNKLIDLQPSINILIWVMWFFDHPVLFFFFFFFFFSSLGHFHSHGSTLSKESPDVSICAFLHFSYLPQDCPLLSTLTTLYKVEMFRLSESTIISFSWRI
jgi:hypothetical protein